MLVAAAAVVGGAVGLTRGGDARPLLPDLVQRSPYQLVGQTAGSGRGRRFRIGFASAVENHGAGPLIVVGSGGRAGKMPATQVIERSEGSTRRRRGVGTLRYTRSTDHAHWHLLGFERYTLRALTPDGTVLRRDRKTGFCLGDRYDARPGTRAPGEPATPRWQEECGRSLPGLRQIEEGISVGYGDDYFPVLEGQYLDVTRVPEGRYELMHAVNVDRRLQESDYRNNAASVIVEIAWPGGYGRPPSIDVVRRCGDGRRCLPRR